MDMTLFNAVMNLQQEAKAAASVAALQKMTIIKDCGRPGTGTAYPATVRHARTCTSSPTRPTPPALRNAPAARLAPAASARDASLTRD
jgi:hypothetical protein